MAAKKKKPLRGSRSRKRGQGPNGDAVPVEGMQGVVFNCSAQDLLSMMSGLFMSRVADLARQKATSASDDEGEAAAYYESLWGTSEDFQPWETLSGATRDLWVKRARENRDALERRGFIIVRKRDAVPAT